MRPLIFEEDLGKLEERNMANAENADFITFVEV